MRFSLRIWTLVRHIINVAHDHMPRAANGEQTDNGKQDLFLTWRGVNWIEWLPLIRSWSRSGEGWGEEEREGREVSVSVGVSVSLSLSLSSLFELGGATGTFDFGKLH